jgi:RHH-type proline utilization regulon transcriptional repressor/proline dehydrogenase/delta 1-pyrroline-5-carboxylate dehydrogenase
MDNNPHRDPIVAEAVSLAEKWQKKANELMTLHEKQHQQQMMRLIRHPLDRVILTRMIDQSFRSKDPGRVADQVNYIMKRYGVPSFFTLKEQALMRMFLTAGRHMPGISVPRMIQKIREDSARSVIPGEKEVLYAHLRRRKDQGVRMNLNRLGEAVLGEGEALSRLLGYLGALRDTEIEHISVKISTIYSQINSLAFEHTVDILEDRLSQLFRSAEKFRYTRKDGARVPNFVNLDMEEFRDLEITVSAFVRALEQEELKQHSAGIVLQSYLPDSWEIQQRLVEWARKRVDGGGAPIRMRIVKGANMEMEQAESAIRNWPLAPYDNKLDTDANYKRMVDFGMRPENIRAVRLGIASHNLFELAYAWIKAQKNQVTEHVTLELLEGMANHVWRAIREVSGSDILLYAPVAEMDDFINAIAYLIRRLDENTSEENFLRYSFNLKTDSDEWEFLKRSFIRSCEYKEHAGIKPHRTQNRITEIFPDHTGTYYQGEFANEPDTDWSLPPNRKWAEAIRERWMRKPDDPPEPIPLVIGGTEIFEGRETLVSYDLNQVHPKVRIAECALAGIEDIEQASAAARSDPDGWRDRPPAERHLILSKAALEIRKARGDLIGSAAASTGKVFTESDPEVSEAVDFTEFYPFSAQRFYGLENVRCRGRGVGLIITPWNFPIAIPCGGIAAALAAGNTVIFKPSTSAVLPAWLLCQCFWRAGVPKTALQFVPCAGSSAGRMLTAHPEVDFIIFTGGTDTGMAILNQRPGLVLAAETGGKNAVIVTAMSDRDQAIKHILHSAFSNCGQKCSAASLVILEKEVYEDEKFRRQLVDAARSWATGPVWEFQNKMGPLIQPPQDPLKTALTGLGPGEEWALKPENLGGNPCLWTPGIKWNVIPGSITHMTEFFGPLIGVMKADDLDQAIQLVNQTRYGLTSGLESLDEREHDKWKAGVRAGNLYINRGTTGAVVLRQPFGGMGKSALGAGIKAGGPNYVSQFMAFEETALPPAGPFQQDHPLLRVVQEWKQKLDWGQLAEYEPDLRKTIRAVKSYLYHTEQEFGQEKDYFRIRGEDNVLRYLPVGTVLVRIHPKDTLFEVLARIAAVKIARCDLIVGLPRDLDNAVVTFLLGQEGRRILGKTRPVRHSPEELIDSLSNIHRIRYAGPDRVPEAVSQAAAKLGLYIARNPVFMDGRLEMLNYFQEQSVSTRYHRYGNLGERAV